jgi:type III pantothenate kinase
MLLALDVGNTNTKLGLYSFDSEDAAKKPTLVAHWRVTTHHQQTADEYSVLFVNLFKMNGIEPSQVTHIIISSVVPPVETTLRQVCETCFHVDPLFVEPGIKTGMPVLVDNPSELGADRLADSIGAFERYGGPCIVVNFGTATRFEVISARGGISADALFSHAARLSRVDIKRPSKVIGTNTITHLQSGLYYGYIGLVDGILERMIAELGAKPRVIACGGLAHMIAEGSRFITDIDDMLTLDGLLILFERNRTLDGNRTGRPRNRAH